MLLKKEETNLQTFKTDDGLEIIIDTVTGESFASQQLYSRISGISPGGVNKRVKLIVSSDLVKTAEIQTVKGLRTVSLITEDLIAEWLPKDNVCYTI